MFDPFRVLVIGKSYTDELGAPTRVCDKGTVGAWVELQVPLLKLSKT